MGLRRCSTWLLYLYVQGWFLVLSGLSGLDYTALVHCGFWLVVLGLE